MRNVIRLLVAACCAMAPATFAFPVEPTLGHSNNEAGETMTEGLERTGASAEAFAPVAMIGGDNNEPGETAAEAVAVAEATRAGEIGRELGAGSGEPGSMPASAQTEFEARARAAFLNEVWSMP